MQMNVYLAWPLAGANTFLSVVHARTPRLSMGAGAGVDNHAQF
jgi:hypothetical protein